MKGKYEKSERRGLPGGPNEMFTYTTGIFSTQGYKRDSPDVDNPFNIIPSGDITMKGVDFPVLGTDNLGNSKMMTPGNDYKFPGDMVFELPMAKDGLSLDPPPKKREMINLHDFLITEKDLEFLNSERCFRGNCLENTRKAFDATAGSIWGVPYTANVWGKDDLDITSIRNTPTKQQTEDFPWMKGDRGMGTADSWDIQGNIVRAGGKTLYNRNVEGSTFQPGQYPIGSIYSFGPAGTDKTDKEERQKGFSVRKGLQPSHHSVMSVGVNEKGEIILYDAHLGRYDTEENIIKQLAKELWAGGLNYELEAVGVPESYAKLTPGNIEQSDNFYRPRYFTEYQFDVDRLDKIRQDPKFRIKEDNEFRAPRLDKGAMREFTQSLKDNKETMMEALRLTSDEYDDLANLSIALAMAESEGGGGLSVDWAGSTQGLTQLNFDNIKNDEVLSRQLTMFNESVRGPQKIKQLADLRDPAKSAIATLIYTNAGRRRSSKLHEEGLEPGVRNFYDNTGLKDLVRSSSSRINRSGIYLDELNDRVSFSDIPGWNEKDVKKITTSLNALTGTNRYQADIDDDGDVYIKMKTLGNDPNMSDAMKVAYWWQSPTSLKTGDAQGGNVHAKRIEGYYKAISEKTPEVSSDNLMASNTEIPEMQVGGSLPKFQNARETKAEDLVLSNDATRVDMPMLTPEMLAQARGWDVDEPMYSPYPMPAGSSELKAEDLVPPDLFSNMSPAQREVFKASVIAAERAKEERWLEEYMRRSPGGDLFPDQGLKPITYNEEVSGWLPVAGEYIDAKNTAEALKRGDYLDAGLNAAGFLLPFIPGSFLKKLATSAYTPKFSKPSILEEYRSKFPIEDIRGAGTGDYSNLGIDELGLSADDFTSLTNYERSAISQVNQAQAADDVFNTFVQRYADFNTDDALANQLADFSRKNPRTKFEINLGKDVTPSKRMQEIFDDPELNIHNVFSIDSKGPMNVPVKNRSYTSPRFYDGSAHGQSVEFDKNLQSYGQQGFYAINVPTGKPVRQSLSHISAEGVPFEYVTETVPVADYMVNKGLMEPDNIMNIDRYRGLGDMANQHNFLLSRTNRPSVIISNNRGFAGLQGGNDLRMKIGRVDVPTPGKNVPGYNTKIAPLLKQEFELSKPFEGTFIKLPGSLKTYYNSKGEAFHHVNETGYDQLGSILSDGFFTKQKGGSLPKAQTGREFFSNDATSVDVPILPHKMVNEGIRLTDIPDIPDLSSVSPLFSKEYLRYRESITNPNQMKGESDEDYKNRYQKNFVERRNQEITDLRGWTESLEADIDELPFVPQMLAEIGVSPLTFAEHITDYMDLGDTQKYKNDEQKSKDLYDTIDASVDVAGLFFLLASGNPSGPIALKAAAKKYGPAIYKLLVEIGAEKGIDIAEQEKWLGKSRTGLPEAQEGKEIYKVKSGDTFLGIANRLGISREDFIEANPDINIDKLSLGQKLNIPVKKPYVPTNDVIPSEMLWRQAFAESNWETDVENKGGYKGLGQIGDDVITDYKKAFKVKEVDPFDPVQNSTIHKWYMNKLYNSEWVNKPNQDPNVRLAKALVAYNWGPKTARKWFTNKKKAGVDIYNSFDWLEDLPSEPKGYIDMIIFNKNTPTRKYVEDLAETMTTDTALTNQIINLYKRAGGEMNKLEMYKGYINGEFDGTDLEPKAQRVYDRMNRVYYAPAKKAGMSPPNFIMTNIIPRQLQTVL